MIVSSPKDVLWAYKFAHKESLNPTQSAQGVAADGGDQSSGGKSHTVLIGSTWPGAQPFRLWAGAV